MVPAAQGGGLLNNLISKKHPRAFRAPLGAGPTAPTLFGALFAGTNRQGARRAAFLEQSILAAPAGFRTGLTRPPHLEKTSTTSAIFA